MVTGLRKAANVNGKLTATLTKHPGPLTGEAPTGEVHPFAAAVEGQVVVTVKLAVLMPGETPRTYVWIVADVAGQPAVVHAEPRTMA